MKTKECIMALEPLSIRQMESRTSDVYEAVVVMSKRAKQVLSNRIMAEMMVSTEEVEMGVYDQVIEKNQIYVFRNQDFRYNHKTL